MNQNTTAMPDAAWRRDCPCKRTHCERHGNCAACREYHKTKKYPAVCERQGKEEKSRQQRTRE